MSAARQVPLAEFSRDHKPIRVPMSSRATAGVLTSILYALFALLLWRQPTLWSPPDTQIGEVTATLLPDRPHRKIVPLPPPFLAHLIRPHPETIAPPTFTVASAAPVAPAQLPASAAQSSPIEGGVPAGNDKTGAAASANGSNGNGNALAGCYDADWGRAVTERIRPFFYYPGAARARHATGVVMVDFVVRRNGWLDGVEIGKSSGDWALDKAAYEIVRGAQPLPVFSARMHLDRIDLELPVNFGVPGLDLKPTVGDCR
jgi:protein TonB